jgi:hypothetical protein
MFIVNHFYAPVPFFVEEPNGAVLKMLMRSGKIPFTRWPEIRMDKLHHEKVMDPHRLVMAFAVVTVPRRSDAMVIHAGFLSCNLRKQLT